MTDLLQILPTFPHPPFAALLPAIEHHGLTTTDLLALHPADIAKQTRLPLLDLKRFIAAVQASLSDQLGPPEHPLVSLDETRRQLLDLSLAPDSEPEDAPASPAAEPPLPTPDPGPAQPGLISTLDPDLDRALGGGVPVGVVTEFAGESGAGKTQVLLALCLAVQLPPPHGLGRQALYISTEAPLVTTRLTQMLADNPVLRSVDADSRPSLDAIHNTVTPDLETQDHILAYQVPVLLSRHDVGLVVVDSVAANYRAEFDRLGSRGSNMAARSAELVRLGALLRDLARRKDIAVVVANQVADRFASSAPVSRAIPGSSLPPPPKSSGAPVPESPLASRSMPPPSSGNLPNTPSSPVPFSLQDPDGPPPPPALLLDHQQRWFTGWGDDPHASHSLKTPSLGLVWSTQIACRVALLKRPVYGRIRQAAPLDATAEDDSDLAAPTLRAWRRWMKVVFAPHAAASGQGLEDAVEYEVTNGGLKAVARDRQGRRKVV